MVLFECSFLSLARHDLDGRGASANHGAEIRAAFVLLPIRIVDTVVDRPVDRLEGDFSRHAGGSDPPRLLSHRSLVPAGFLPVVCPHVECIIDHDRPDPSRGAIGLAVLAEWRNVQVIGFSDPAEFVFRPRSYREISLKHFLSSYDLRAFLKESPGVSY